MQYDDVINDKDYVGFKRATEDRESRKYNKLDGCIVWNAHNTVLGEEALLIHIVPVGYAT